MKLNMTKKDARFIVVPEKRKVICIVDDTQDMFLNFAGQNFKGFDPFFLPHKVLKQLIMPGRFIGVATCSENNEWNEETGKLIAFSRAKDKMQNSFFKRANTYVRLLDETCDQAVDSINRYGSKLEINTQRRHDKIDKLVGTE